jgi:hypothetical protein
MRFILTLSVKRIDSQLFLFKKCIMVLSQTLNCNAKQSTFNLCFHSVELGASWFPSNNYTGPVFHENARSTWSAKKTLAYF